MVAIEKAMKNMWIAVAARLGEGSTMSSPSPGFKLCLNIRPRSLHKNEEHHRTCSK
jgi:hypothetical protein